VNPLAVERSRSDGCELLEVEGELDIATASLMISVLNEAYSDLSLPMVVDLSRVDFMDSTGLALLINANRRVRRDGHGFAILCPEGPLTRLFEIADMVERLRVCRTMTAARQAATQAAGA
jgi:anti-sigma B factor antagonist